MCDILQSEYMYTLSFKCTFKLSVNTSISFAIFKKSKYLSFNELKIDKIYRFTSLIRELQSSEDLR